MRFEVIIVLIPLFTALITAATTYIVTSYNLNKPKEKSILADQLEKVLSPIYVILSTVCDQSDEQRQKINEVIINNFTLVPPSYNMFNGGWQSVSPPAHRTPIGQGAG